MTMEEQPKQLIVRFFRRISLKNGNAKLYLLLVIWNFLLFIFFVAVGDQVLNDKMVTDVMTATPGGLYERYGKFLFDAVDGDPYFDLHLFHSDGDIENIKRLFLY